MAVMSIPIRGPAQVASRPRIVVRDTGALAILTEMAIEFDISWGAKEPWTDFVGDGCK